jgi:SWI/SNF-related matrix-associated actin-dependent regulator of chromatin subfamily A3
MTTKLFQAVYQLSAKLRWCLTGTPIQNSLEDLASLVTFIRAIPLDNLVNFRKHIVSPLLKGTRQGLENIRLLLDSICLRRTKKLLNLPDTVDCEQLVEFSTPERLQYNETQEEMLNAIKQQDCHARNVKGYFGVFQLQLQLRRLCNHGTFQKPTGQAAGDILFDPEEALALLQKKADAKCTYYSIEVTGVNAIEEQISGRFTVCGHLLCSECLPRYEKSVRNEKGGLQCSLCLRKLPADYLATNEDGSHVLEGNSTSTEPYFRHIGLSSKISSLTSDIQTLHTEGKRYATNYLISNRYCSYTLPQRQKILEEYDQNPSVRNLLMTLGTGAVGYRRSCQCHIENQLIFVQLLGST